MSLFEHFILKKCEYVNAASIAVSVWANYDSSFNSSSLLTSSISYYWVSALGNRLEIFVTIAVLCINSAIITSIVPS